MGYRYLKQEGRPGPFATAVKGILPQQPQSFGKLGVRIESNILVTEKASELFKPRQRA
jgi:Xaa-Pro aminopeptidase